MRIEPDDGAERIGDAGHGPARRRAYASARRHSSRVRWLKRVIPLGAGIAVLLVTAVTFLDPFGQLVPEGVSVGALGISGTKITMEAPRLSGFRGQDGRPYEVTAAQALQDVTRPTVIELKEMRARMTLDDRGGVARLEAATGVFDTQKEQLELRTDVRVTTADGQEARLRSASVDFKGGTVVSNEPVWVRMSGGIVEADSLSIGESGKVISFTGRVRTQFDAPAPSSGAALPEQPAAVAPAAPIPLASPLALPSATPGPRTSQAEPLSLRP